MHYFANMTRPEGEPKVLQSGPSSLGSADRMARALGWFSLALGAVELFAPHRVTRTLGMRGQEGLVRAYGVREIGAGIMALSVDKGTGLTARIAGDGLDIATLMQADHRYNRKRDNVAMALALVMGITVLDVVTRIGLGARHRRSSGRRRDYSDRSGFPRGVEHARGTAPQAALSVRQPVQVSG